MRIVWSPGAFDDILRLDAFLRANSPVAASRMYDAILAAVEILSDFPEIGRLAPAFGEDHRELTVPFASGGYLVLYFLRGEVVILRVRHMREADYPEDQP